MHMRRFLLISVGIYLATFAYLLLRWDSIPEPVPIHIGPSGVDAWADKTWLSVGGALWIGLAISAMMAACALPADVATRRREVPEADALPYSETAAQRVTALLNKTNDFLGHMAVGTALVLASAQLMMCFPRLMPTPLWIAGIVVYCMYAIAASIRIMGKSGSSWEQLPPDEQEQKRVERLKLKASMGFYKEPLDQMPVSIMPAEPGKIQINTAHPVGKRLMRRIMWAIVACLIVIVVLVVLL